MLDHSGDLSRFVEPMETWSRRVWLQLRAFVKEEEDK